MDRAGKRRVLFVAIDSGDGDLVKGWAAEGLLPNLRGFFATSLAIDTVAPPGVYVGAIWPTAYTGVNPGRHGCHSWQQVRPGTYEIYRFYPSLHLRREPFWDELSRAGRRVAVVDVPLTGPSAEINGLQVVEWGCHDPEHGLRTWPPGLADEIVARHGRHPIPRNCNAHRTADQMALFREDLLRGVATKTEVCLELYRRERWDLFAAVYSESHCAGHQCYHLHDPRHFRHDPALARRLGDPILDVYRAIDAGLGRLLAETDGDTTVLVFASHGLGPHYDGSYLLPLILHRLGVADASGRHGRGCCFPIVNNAVSGAIRVNLVGREPQGKVRPGPGFDAFCAELVHDLKAILNLDTGTPLVREVLYTRDLYRGEHVEHLPDLFVEWDHRYPVASLWSPRVGVIHQPWKGCRTGDHRPEGLLLARGPGVTPGRLGRVVQVMDLAPTITELLGVQLPDVDGTAIAEVAAPPMLAPQAA